jgi:hypothetical protein
MWDDEYEIYLHDVGVMTKRNVVEHDKSPCFYEVIVELKKKQNEEIVKLKMIKVLVAMIFVVLICVFIVMIFK